MIAGSGTIAWRLGGLAAAAPSGGEGGGGSLLSLLPMVLMFVAIYVIMFLPARKRQKRLQEMIGGLKRGDKVITTGGIHGMVVGISDQVIQVRVADNVTVEISKNAVASLQQTEQS
jgi:preprotein translocase subunit YajC